MNILAVESSGAAAGAAVMSDGILRADGYANTGLTHSESLLPMIDNVLTMAKLTVSDIDLFAVSSGPGSFTGLRIGIGTVKGLAYGQGKKVCAVTSLEALCYNVPDARGIICPVIDAGHGEVYNALYKWENGALCEICAPRAVLVTELCTQVSEGTAFTGDGILQHGEYIKERIKDAIISPPHFTFPRACGVAMAALGKDGILPQEVEPIYLKKPQAERQLLEKQK